MLKTRIPYYFRILLLPILLVWTNVVLGSNVEDLKSWDLNPYSTHIALSQDFKASFPQHKEVPEPQEDENSEKELEEDLNEELREKKSETELSNISLLPTFCSLASINYLQNVFEQCFVRSLLKKTKLVLWHNQATYLLFCVFLC